MSIVFFCVNERVILFKTIILTIHNHNIELHAYAEMKNKFIERDSKVGDSIFNQRSLEKDFRTLIPSIKKGMNVLDVGCGTGAISAGIAKLVGDTGSVTGIDHTQSFITNGEKTFAEITNLNLIEADIFSFEPETKYDLIVSARVLQWLSTPEEALQKMKSLLNPGGQISILDYNHTALEFNPEPPKSMQNFYKKWLQWRSDAGMNNQISEDLPTYFKNVGLKNIQVENSNEVYLKGQSNFESKVSIWAKVANSIQMVKEGYSTDQEEQVVIAEYNNWIQESAKRMEMKLKEVKGMID